VADTPGGDAKGTVELLAPYVDIDATDMAIYKMALQAVLPAAYAAAGADKKRASELTAAAVQGNVDANVINALIEQIPEAERPPPIAIDGLDRGVSYASMGKTGLFGLLGARYIALKRTYDLYAAFRTASKAGDDPYGSDQSAWLADRLDAEADATWKVLGNSTALTSLIVDLAPFEAQLMGLLPATQLYLSVEQWDGFPVARQALFEQLYARNAVIITGDIHAAYFTDYGADKAGNRVVEFTGPGVSSGSFAELLRSTAETIPQLADSPLVGLLISNIDGLLSTAFPALKVRRSNVNGVVVVRVTGSECVGQYTVLDGEQALIDRTGESLESIEFERTTVTIPRVDGRNGEPTVG
jgi:alkaline phosphatase D